MLACAFVIFLFFGLLLKHEGRVFSDGVIQPGFVSPGMHFLVFVRGEPGVGVGGGLLSLWLEDFIVVLAISFFSLCTRNGFFVCLFFPLSFAVSSYGDLVGFSLSQLLLRNSLIIHCCDVIIHWYVKVFQRCFSP